MPYKWTEPDKVLDKNGIAIYNVYRDGFANECMEYWYTTDQCENEELEFDIRDLENYDTDRTHEEILEEAIVKKLIPTQH